MPRSAVQSGDISPCECAVRGTGLGSRSSALPLCQAGVTWRRYGRIYALYKGAGVGCLLLLWAVFLSFSNLQLLPPPAGCCCHPLLEPHGVGRAGFGLTQPHPLHSGSAQHHGAAGHERTGWDHVAKAPWGSCVLLFLLLPACPSPWKAHKTTLGAGSSRLGTAAVAQPSPGPLL